VVATCRVLASSFPSLLTGKPSVVQMLMPVAPGRFEKVRWDTSSIVTIARPAASWPVTTRRTCNAIASPYAKRGA
jgi:hypothetical protein